MRKVRACVFFGCWSPSAFLGVTAFPCVHFAPRCLSSLVAMCVAECLYIFMGRFTCSCAFLASPCVCVLQSCVTQLCAAGVVLDMPAYLSLFPWIPACRPHGRLCSGAIPHCSSVSSGGRGCSWLLGVHMYACVPLSFSVRL